MKDGVPFARKIDPGFLQISERLKIIIEFAASDPCRNGHQHRVTRLLQTACKRYRAMTTFFMAMDRIAADLQSARTCKKFSRRCNIFFKRHRRCHDLKGRTGLVNFGDRFIAPHNLPQLS